MSDHNPPSSLPRIAVALRDGSVAELSPIRPQDRGLLVAGFDLMSPESRYARFGSGLSRLSESEVRYLTEVDHVDHVAWGATIAEEPAGVGRFIRSADAGCAEVAVAVVDVYQRRGLGRSLFNALVASARAVGVDSFCFSVHPANRGVLAMIEGIEITLDEEAGLLAGTVHLEDVGRVEGEERYVEVLAAYRDAS